MAMPTTAAIHRSCALSALEQFIVIKLARVSHTGRACKPDSPQSVFDWNTNELARAGAIQTFFRLASLGASERTVNRRTTSFPMHGRPPLLVRRKRPWPDPR